MKRDVFKTAQIVIYICATFVRKFATKNFQKSPNLITLVVSSNHTSGY